MTARELIQAIEHVVEYLGGDFDKPVLISFDDEHHTVSEVSVEGEDANIEITIRPIN